MGESKKGKEERGGDRARKLRTVGNQNGWTTLIYLVLELYN